MEVSLILIHPEIGAGNGARVSSGDESKEPSSSKLHLHLILLEDSKYLKFPDIIASCYFQKPSSTTVGEVPAAEIEDFILSLL